MTEPVVVVGVIGNDIHVVANRVLVSCLEAYGFRVLNIGTSKMPEDFAEAALEVDAQAVLIGSLNGEAAHWCTTLRAALHEADKSDVKVYLGGNVVTGEWSPDAVEAYFHRHGIDRVYYGHTDFDAMIGDLKRDLSDGRPLG